MKAFNKVFEIGRPRTGTTSLGRAYEQLGLKHKGWDPVLAKMASYNLPKVLEVAREYEAFQDGPWHDIDFRILDKEFPNSRFIIMERDDEAWYRSMVIRFDVLNEAKWFLSKSKEEVIISKRQKYDYIKRYFSNRPGDLLVMDLAVEPDPWTTLCQFLGLPKPEGVTNFPHSNKSPDRPNDARAAKDNYQLGDVLMQENKLDEALSAYQRAIELRPNYAQAHRRLSLIFDKKGCQAEALAAARRAVECALQNAALHYNLGNLLRKANKLDEALSAYQRAIELRPNYAEALKKLSE